MKKLTTSLTLALLALTAMTSTASAQPVTKEAERYDYDRDFQLVGAGVGGTVGVVTGVLTGGLASRLVCSNCSVWGFGVGGILVGAGGATIGASLMGGDHAGDEQYTDAFVGGVLGGIVGLPLGAVVGVALVWSDVALASLAGAATAGLVMGIGASWGYQSRYNAPILKDVTLAPMITPEHNGLMVMGRF